MAQINKNDVGKRIKKIREELNLTLEQMGNLVDEKATKSVVRSWEVGINLPNSNRIARIAELGHVSLDYLLTGKEFETSSFSETPDNSYNLKLAKSLKYNSKFGWPDKNILPDDRNYYRTLGYRIKEIRNELQLTESEFATYVQPPATELNVMSWEINKTRPTLQRLESIALLQDISLEYLLTGWSEMTDLELKASYIAWKNRNESVLKRYSDPKYSNADPDISYSLDDSHEVEYAIVHSFSDFYIRNAIRDLDFLDDDNLSDNNKSALRNTLFSYSRSFRNLIKFSIDDIADEYKVTYLTGLTQEVFIDLERLIGLLSVLSKEPNHKQKYTKNAIERGKQKIMDLLNNTNN